MSSTDNKLETSSEAPGVETASSGPRLAKDETELVTNPIGGDVKKEESSAQVSDDDSFGGGEVYTSVIQHYGLLKQASCSRTSHSSTLLTAAVI